MKKDFLILGVFTLLMMQNVYAATSGNCGTRSGSGTEEDPYVWADNCTWEIVGTELIISGTGEIGNYPRDCSREIYFECTTTAPWRWSENTSKIQTLTIGEGITSIGEDAFEDMPFTTVNLPDGLVSIGSSAFKECDFLSDINLPDSLRQISSGALAGTALKNVVIPEGTEDNPTIVEAQVFRGPNAYQNGNYLEQQLESLVVGENTIINPQVLFFGQGVLVDFDKFKMYCADGNTSCITAMETSINLAKELGQIDSLAVLSDYLTTYTKDGNGFYQIDDKLYATADLMTHNAACDDAANCQEILDAASQGKPFEVGGKYYATLDLFANGAACTDKKNCEDILSSNGNPFKVGSKIYNSMADFANGNYVKHRIYTIEEANFVAGPVNTIRIKYR